MICKISRSQICIGVTAFPVWGRHCFCGGSDPRWPVFVLSILIHLSPFGLLLLSYCTVLRQLTFHHLLSRPLSLLWLVITAAGGTGFAAAAAAPITFTTATTMIISLS
jgi:hypothetical protein